MNADQNLIPGVELCKSPGIIVEGEGEGWREALIARRARTADLGIAVIADIAHYRKNKKGIAFQQRPLLDLTSSLRRG